MQIYRSICPSKPLPKPRHATLRALYQPSSATAGKPEVLDPGAIILYFPAPHSITGQDVLELHLHGGPAIIRAVLAAIHTCSAFTSHSPIRHAEPGEFTRRAFLNDRLSLPQIEALGDTLSAYTEQQRRLSLKGSGVGLTSLYENWRRHLIEARGTLEALIDFSEDQSFETTPKELLARVTNTIIHLKSRLENYVQNAVKGELLRDGISISLVGAPNVGKSSLLNRIVGREAVIVSPEAGTTRDVVDLRVDLGGYVMVVGDTAGLRIGDVGGTTEGRDIVGDIEKEGIKRAKKRVMEGDVIILVLAFERDKQSGQVTLPIPREVVSVVKDALSAVPPKEVLIAANKLDILIPSGASGGGGQLPAIPDVYQAKIRAIFPTVPEDAIVGISCKHDHPKRDLSASVGPENPAIQPILHSLIALFQRMTSPTASSSLPVNSVEAESSLAATTRQRLLIEECLRYLEQYLRVAQCREGPGAGAGVGADAGAVDVVIAAEELRSAAECLAKITGKGEGAGDVGEVLGVVFERFCVGK